MTNKSFFRRLCSAAFAVYRDMAIGIVDRDLGFDDYSIYDVYFDDDRIETLLTSSPYMVDSWIDDIFRIHRHRLHSLIVGLDVEWRPNSRHYDNPVATIQLCVGRRCIIFQLLYASEIPDSLIHFLGDAGFTFVGVGILSDVEKLMEDHNLNVANTVDLRFLAAGRLNRPDLSNAGIKTLASEILGKDFNKPRRVTMSRWDSECLTYAQVQYACVDAFVSFEIGRCLNAANCR